MLTLKHFLKGGVFWYNKYMKQVSAYILYDNKNRVLLMHRTFDAPTNPGYWGLFGGKIEDGETPKIAAAREAKEELGIELKNVKLFKVYNQEDKYGKQIRHIFIGPLNYPIETLRKQQKEGLNLNLFTLDDLNNIKISKNDLEILNDVIKNKTN